MDLGNSQESDFLSYITKMPNFIDVENVLELLDLLQGINKHPATEWFRNYKTTTELPSKRGATPFQDMLDYMESLREKVIDDVYHQYGFENKKIEKVCQTYQPLISLLMSLNQNETSIFTTNYDKVIEKFCYNVGVSITDGFSTEPSKLNPEEFEWSPDLFNIPKNPNTQRINLFKLHGSLSWRIRNDDKIVRIAPEERARQTKQYKDNLVVYPAQKSVPEDDPFKTLFEHFQKELMSSNIAIFIGFAFRDDYLNSLIREYPEKNKLIIISPHATDLSKKLKKAGFKSNIIPIGIPFGDNNLITEIKKAINNVTENETSI